MCTNQRECEGEGKGDGEYECSFDDSVVVSECESDLRQLR